ncbi:MAG: ATP-dependent Clp protease adaptor ClpS [Bacteroidetes bacterium]|nr:MAG: ATP-dependent Clp protease adaptor ClpS [Bacteroidota bacterium]
MGKSENEKRYLPSDSDVTKADYCLILINDDDNHFDDVIRCLVEVCGFDYERAEQCTLLAHLKGQYTILSGEKYFLEEMQGRLNQRNIRSKVNKK